MTPLKIFEAALAVTGRKSEDGEEMIELLPMWLNILMQEILPYENNIRAANGREQLLNAPFIGENNLEEELDLSPEICRICLPYGVASFIWAEDENDYRALSERAKYVNALTEADKPIITTVKNVYE